MNSNETKAWAHGGLRPVSSTGGGGGGEEGGGGGGGGKKSCVEELKWAQHRDHYHHALISLASDGGGAGGGGGGGGATSVPRGAVASGPEARGRRSEGSVYPGSASHTRCQGPGTTGSCPSPGRPSLPGVKSL
ncbi:hypothetical protein Pmani_025986 [Petrolisthes manimaculis]|uniref:Uncharacterized protein n=1 Tax=Petrolisthes manimaculis TaxID=1843537 RepID=A0AAE1P4Z1_9EUCA|nr:hypothetical protein Pmani_025986 [Petrolisthes manimaculis]